MKPNQKLCSAILAILSANAPCGHASSSDSGDSPGSSNELGEVVVTATRRSENLQDVPIAITALTAVTLNQLNVQTFDDYLKYLPNVSAASKGPGQGAVYMRGLSTATVGNQTSGGSGSFPNVAIYLDDLSGQLPGRNLDIYAADLERIEVLEGPQGTLFGAGAQAGVIRYITNKPKINVTDAGFDAGYSTTAHGDPNSNVEGYLNVPLIQDTLALRGVIYSDSRGGYIHNVPGTFARQPTDLGIAAYFNGVVPTGSPTLSNSALVNAAYNPVTYQGARLEALYQFNDDWNLLLSQSYQNLVADGVFGENAALGDLDVQQYNQSYNKDKFESTAWTLNGRIGALTAVYTGGYVNRKIDQVTDYTAYARGFFATYYQCDGPSVAAYNGGFASKLGVNACASPSSVWNDVQNDTHWSHEVRLASPSEWRLRFVAGLFYEDYKIQDSANWQFAATQIDGVNEFAPFAPLPGTTQFDPGARGDGVAYFNDITRGYKQRAVFGEIPFDIIPKTLTLTVGERFYSMPSYEVGSVNTIYGCRYGDPMTSLGCTVYGAQTPQPPYSSNLDADNLRKTYSGHKGKANLSWKAMDGILLYATYSEGFRPGGFNKGQGFVPNTSPLYGVFKVPVSYDTDNLKNKELGWKTTLFDHRLQFDGAIYEEDWSNVQLSIYEPLIYGNLVFSANGPSYRVRGSETNLTFKAIDGLTLMGSAAWNSSSQTSTAAVVGNNSQKITLYPTAGLGSELANAPPLQFNLRARYEWHFNDYNAWIQGSGQHTAHSYASVVVPINYEQSPYTTYDASAGIGRGNWTVEAFGQNLTDTRAQLYTNSNDFVLLTTVSRPRILGVHVSYRMGRGNDR
jgi:iron complex outermembrane recepter protein